MGGGCNLVVMEVALSLIVPGDPLMRDPDWRPEQFLCFVCGDRVPIDKPFVHWYGHPANQIVVHLECALGLSEALNEDVVRVHPEWARVD